MVAVELRNVEQAKHYNEVYATEVPPVGCKYMQPDREHVTWSGHNDHEVVASLNISRHICSVVVVVLYEVVMTAHWNILFR